MRGVGTGALRKALETLAADGLIIVRHGSAAVVAGEPSNDPRLSRRRPGPGHDCRLAGRRPHVCHPMKASTLRGIHSILSGAFAAAQRWEWTDRNPATSAKPPTTIRRPVPATSLDEAAKVIAEARARNTALGLYLWLVAVTGVRRGELCGLQIRDIDPNLSPSSCLSRKAVSGPTRKPMVSSAWTTGRPALTATCPGHRSGPAFRGRKRQPGGQSRVHRSSGPEAYAEPEHTMRAEASYEADIEP